MPNPSVLAAGTGLPIEIRQFFRGDETPLRLRIEAAVDTMLALLDELDGDFDLEPDNDSEPSLGREGDRLSLFRGLDGFANCDAEQDDGEEPELTALETCGKGFVYCGPDDAEDTHDAEDDPAEWGIADLDAIAEQHPSDFYGRTA